jgi:DNA (cytosine-5)-methyltransferase 1
MKTFQLRQRSIETPNGRSVLSLFTGAGGLDLGLEASGFKPVLCVEIDGDSRETLKLNRPSWRLADPGDIHALEPGQLLRQAAIKPRELTLLAGGTPCQPFSKSSYWFNGDAPRLRDPRARTLHAYLDSHRGAAADVSEFRGLRSDPE